MEHIPVMASEVLEALSLSPGDLAVDGTLGLAGHARKIAASIAPGGTLIGFDWDDAMLAAAKEALAEMSGVTFEAVHGDYRGIPGALGNRKADGIFLDLGVNNMHLMDADRGFSFRSDGPLDMRMDRRRSETAADLLNRLSEKEIEDLIFREGGERWARRIAKVIVERRPLQTTSDLSEAVLAAIPVGARPKGIHAATRTFQAVRIAVNEELSDLEGLFSDLAESLAPDGRLAVLTYHSGEDRPCKRAFRTLAQSGEFTDLYRRPLRPTEGEVSDNPKARSAKLRALQRTAS